MATKKTRYSETAFSLFEGFEGFSFEENSSEAQKKATEFLEAVSKEEAEKANIIDRTISPKDLIKKLERIKIRVYQKLGSYADKTLVIRTRQELHDYITKAIEAKVIAIDTETNNTTVPIGCKLMGLCLYSPGQLQAYVPCNHVDFATRERLSWQLTEAEIGEELQRLIDAKTFSVTHNGKFDYEVLHYTCGVKIRLDWDTQLGAKLLDENELAALKAQYVLHVESTSQKYNIERLFKGVEYAVVDPSLFALYAATDSYKTYMLMLYQKAQFELEDNQKIYKNLFLETEIPVQYSTIAMEETGIYVNKDRAKRLSDKYHKKLDEIHSQLEAELEKLRPQINKWRATPEALSRTKKYAPKKSKSTADKIEQDYPEKDNIGRFKWGKSKAEILGESINVASNDQLKLLLYEVMGYPDLDNKAPRSVDEVHLVALNKTTPSPIIDLILKEREYKKILSTYVDAIPKCINSVDGRVHPTFKQYGAKTGRYSCTEPNVQNIPSHLMCIRLMFEAETKNHTVSREEDDNKYIVPYTDEVETSNGWVKVKDIRVGDMLCEDGGLEIVTNITRDEQNNYILWVQ